MDKELIKRTFCNGFSDDEVNLFIAICDKTGLSPEARQIYAISRWDSRQQKNVLSAQTSIDGFRVIADRTGKYTGQLGPFFCGKDGIWSDVWLGEGYPIAAKIGVLRSDFKEPIWSVAKWDSYVQKKKDGKTSDMWHKMPDIMISKCAESLALRKAFPQELSDLYTKDEMQGQDDDENNENKENKDNQNRPSRKQRQEQQQEQIQQLKQQQEQQQQNLQELKKKRLDVFIKKVCSYFSTHAVSEKMLEEWLGCKLEAMSEEHFVLLRSIQEKINSGMPVEEAFDGFFVF